MPVWLGVSANARVVERGRLPGAPVSRIAFHVGGYRLTVVPAGHTHVASRAALDDWLLRRAIEAGAHVRLGQPAGLARRDEGWGIILGDEPIAASYVLIACGLGRVPRELGIRNQSGRSSLVAQQWIEPLRVGLPAYGDIELHWLRGGYIGLASPDDAGCVVALAAERRAVNGVGPLEGLRRLNPRNPVWEHLQPDAARAHDSKGAAAFPWRPDRLGDRNVLLIGDAAGYAEPFSGTGMAQAMYSAECAARAILEDAEAAFRRYTLLMGRHRRAICKTLALSALLRNKAAGALLSRRIACVEPWLARCVERIHVRGSL